MSNGAMLSTIKLTLEYNGSGFAGWQVQPGLRTVQGELARVLEIILRSPALELTASGRTDAGVHARGQVVSFKTASDCSQIGKLGYAIGSLLRDEVSVTEVVVMPDDFNARFSSHRKQYSYRIFTRLAAPILEKDFVWHVKRPLDVQRMQDEALALVGQHDFSSLRSADCVARNPIRTIDESEIFVAADEIIYRVVARGFLKQMVRNITGTLVGLGMGRLASKNILEVIAAKNRAAGGVTAPACGLCLDWVRYETES